MKIHVSESTKSLIDTFPYKIVERGKVEIKGKGEMKTYFVLYKLDRNGNPVNTSSAIFQNVELKNNTNKEVSANDTVEDRGYSPVTMEDVRNSRASLRKGIDNEGEKDAKAENSNKTENKVSTNVTNNDESTAPVINKRNSIKSSLTNVNSGLPKVNESDSKAKEISEKIIISYNNKASDSPKAQKQQSNLNNTNDPPKPQTNSINTKKQAELRNNNASLVSLKMNDTTNNSSDNNSIIAVRTLKTQTCQLL